MDQIAPSNYAESKAIASTGIYPAFFHAMLDRGVALAPGAYEVMFISLAHSAEDLDRTVSLAREASAAVAASIEAGR
jgi:glutamate-1-semialdehyde 2,1-aminomutase